MKTPNVTREGMNRRLVGEPSSYEPKADQDATCGGQDWYQLI